MFLQKEFPDKKALKKITKGAKGVDTSSSMFALQFLKTASDVLLSIDRFFSAKGLSHGRFVALSVLADAGEGGLFPYEIADGMGVSRATASGLLKGLESSGMIVSIQSKTDGRMKKIVMTAEGSSLLEQIQPEYYEFISGFTSGMDKKTMKQFTAILAEIGASVAK